MGQGIKKLIMVRINMMCGKRNFQDGWIHVDAAPFPHIDSKDVYLKDFETDSVDLIYSSHGIAYWDREGIKGLLAAWYRVLKPGATLRLATPDADRMSWLYHCGLPLDRFLGPLYGKMPMGEETIYHKTVWDFISLVKVLHEAGFNNIDRYNHKTTDHAQWDDHAAAYINDTLISLNVEAFKPLYA
jgi:predicted SAM-dependent methyltransferase